MPIFPPQAQLALDETGALVDALDAVAKRLGSPTLKALLASSEFRRRMMIIRTALRRLKALESTIDDFQMRDRLLISALAGTADRNQLSVIDQVSRAIDIADVALVMRAQKRHGKKR